MRAILVLAALVIGLFASAPAEARGGGRFGGEDKIYRIEPIRIPTQEVGAVPAEWRNGVFLARRATIQWFILGAWLQDVEYVAVPAYGDSYWSLSSEQLAALHEVGAISSPAPAYEIPLLDYIFAYSLWIFVALLIAYFGVSAWITSLRAAGVRSAVGNDFAAFLRLALLNAAKADGELADAELDTIADILKSTLGVEVTRAQLIEEAVAANLSSGQLVAHFQMARDAMGAEQQRGLIGALIAVFSADGQWRSQERQLLQRYIVALGTDKSQARRMIDELARAPARA